MSSLRRKRRAGSTEPVPSPPAPGPSGRTAGMTSVASPPGATTGMTAVWSIALPARWPYRPAATGTGGMACVWSRSGTAFGARFGTPFGARFGMPFGTAGITRVASSSGRRRGAEELMVIAGRTYRTAVAWSSVTAPAYAGATMSS